MEYHFGEFRLDVVQRELLRKDEPLGLQNKPMDLLIYLVLHRNRIVSKEELAREVWGEPDWKKFDERTITTTIRTLRKELGDNARELIKTFSGKGYQFRAPTVEMPSIRPGQGRIFIDHDRRWTRVVDAFERARSGDGRFLVLEGESGMGKTWTLEELANQAPLRQAHVSSFSPSTRDTPAGLSSWARSFVDSIMESGRQGIVQLLERKDAEAIAPLVPWLNEIFPGLQPLDDESMNAPSPEFDQQRQAATASLSRLVRRCADGQPLVLVLDDLHEADDSLCRLLLTLARSLRGLPILIVGAYRTAALGRKHPVARLLNELHQLPHFECIRLTGFSIADIESYIRLRGGIASPEVARNVHERTAGNPLFVAEVVSDEIERSMRDRTDEGPALNIRAAVERQLSRLSPACNELLEWASIFGSEFGVEVVPRSGETVEQVVEVLEEAIRAQYLTEAGIGRYRFRHRLVWEVLYKGIERLERARCHAEALLVLERHRRPLVNAQPSELYFHAVNGVLAGTADKAIVYGILAIKEAMREYAFDKVIEYGPQVLKVIQSRSPRDDALYCEVLIRLASARAQLGNIEQAKGEFREAAHVARTTGLWEQQAKAVLGFGMAEEPVGVPASPDLIELLRLALQSAKDGPLRVRLLCRLAVGLSWSEAREQAISLSKQAVDLAKALKNDAELARALLTLRETGWTYDNVSWRLALDDEIIQLARPIPHRELLLLGLSARIADCMELHGLEEARKDIREFEDEAERLQRPRLLWQVMALRCTLAWCDGRLKDAERLSAEAAEYGRQAHQPLAGQVGAIQEWRLRTEQGSLAEFRPSVEEFVRAFPGLRGWRCVLGHVYGELNLRAEAADLLGEISDRNWELLPTDRFRVSALTSAAELCAYVGNARLAKQLYAFLGEHEEYYVVVPYQAAFLGSPAYYLGRLAATMRNWSDARRHFEYALKKNRSVKPMLARVLYEYAAMLRASGRGEGEARRLCRRALGLADRLGIVPLSRKAKALLRKLDRKVPA